MSEKKQINLEVDGRAVQVAEGSMVMEGPARATVQGPRTAFGDASRASGASRRHWRLMQGGRP